MKHKIDQYRRVNMKKSYKFEYKDFDIKEMEGAQLVDFFIDEEIDTVYFHITKDGVSKTIDLSGEGMKSAQSDDYINRNYAASREGHLVKNSIQKVEVSYYKEARKAVISDSLSEAVGYGNSECVKVFLIEYDFNLLRLEFYCREGRGGYDDESDIEPECCEIIFNPLAKKPPPSIFDGMMTSLLVRASTDYTSFLERSDNDQFQQGKTIEIRHRPMYKDEV